MRILYANGGDDELQGESLTLPPALGDPPVNKSEDVFLLFLAPSLTPPELSQYSLPFEGFALGPPPGVARTIALVRDETLWRFRVS